jgi:integrase
MESPVVDSNGLALPIKRKKREPKPCLQEQARPGGMVRWMLAHYTSDGRKREYFTDLDKAKRRLQMLETARTNTGTLAERIARRPEYAADAGRAVDLLAPYGVSLLDAARDWVDCRKALEGTGLDLVAVAREAAALFESRQAALTLAAIWAEFQDDPETRKLSEAYRRDLRKRWRTFEEHFGPEALACDVTPERLRRWLAGLAVGDLSKGNYHRTVGAVFAYALHRGRIAENPFRKVKKPRVEAKDSVEVFTPEQMAALLKAAHPDWLPALAIGGFAGLRPDEIGRLEWKEIHLDTGFIEMTARKSKGGQRRRLVVISENLRAWLEPYAGKAGRVVTCPKGREDRKKRLAAMKAAGIERWPNDVLRHSFASYHLALHRDINETALQLGHTSTAMLFRHYRESVKPEAARAWWALMPGKSRLHTIKRTTKTKEATR